MVAVTQLLRIFFIFLSKTFRLTNPVLLASYSNKVTPTIKFRVNKIKFSLVCGAPCYAAEKTA
jgi:hypothetical protein